MDNKSLLDRLEEAKLARYLKGDKSVPISKTVTARVSIQPPKKKPDNKFKNGWGFGH